jgi:hypothetical protein
MLNALKLGGLVLPCLMLITGCDALDQQPAVSFEAEGYEYKGAADPLVSEPSSERAASLQERFDLIQGRE